jgi:N-acetylmuramoyl-L-alanine amidase
MISKPSPNHNERCDVSGPDMLVLHYTGMESCDVALDRLCDPAAEVSAHYLIDEDGTLYELVGEDRRAWHAGVSNWCGYSDVNSRSIGVELVNPGHENGYRAFPDAQISQLIELCVGILERHDIPQRNIVGHSDIAPIRKQDPGELFPWQGMSAAGVGLWPTDLDVEPVDSGTEAAVLEETGYDTSDMVAALTAFQRRFRQENVDGLLDGQTAILIAAVHRLFTT